jgi:hypothetical protein
MLESVLARRIVIKLRWRLLQLAQAPPRSTPLGDVGWLRARCEDTLGLHGGGDAWCNLSLRQLKNDTVKFNTEFPGLLEQDLLDALESVPSGVPAGGHAEQEEVPRLKNQLAREIVEAMRARLIVLQTAPDTRLHDAEWDVGRLRLRCEDTLGLHAGDDEWCNLSLHYLKEDPRRRPRRAQRRANRAWRALERASFSPGSPTGTPRASKRSPETSG